MNKIICGILFFLLCVSLFENNLYAFSLPDTIVIKRGLPDSVITNQRFTGTANDTTDECDIYLKNRSLLKDVKMVSITDTNLLVVKDSVQRVVNSKEVMKIVFKAGGGFWRGALFGMGLSLAVWGTIGATSGFSEGFGYGILVGLVFGVPVALVGGLVGAFADKDDVYYLVHMQNENKSKRIKYIMGKHK